jgi:hypothetical protein
MPRPGRRLLPWSPEDYGRAKQTHYRSYHVPTVWARTLDHKKPEKRYDNVNAAVRRKGPPGKRSVNSGQAKCEKH